METELKTVKVNPEAREVQMEVEVVPPKPKETYDIAFDRVAGWARKIGEPGHVTTQAMVNYAELTVKASPDVYVGRLAWIMYRKLSADL